MLIVRPTGLRELKNQDVQNNHDMLSEQVRQYLIDQNMYIDDDDQSYNDVMKRLGIDLNTPFAEFHTKTMATSYSGRIGELYNICWNYINSSYEEQISSIQQALSLPPEYIPLDGFEAGGGFFYSRESGEVIELEVGENLQNFQNGIIDVKWGDFNEFLVWYFELE